MTSQPAPEPATPQTPSTEARDPLNVNAEAGDYMEDDPAAWGAVVAAIDRYGRDIAALRDQFGDEGGTRIAAGAIVSYLADRHGVFIRSEAADRAAPADRIDVATLAKAMQTVEPPEPDMDIVAAANGFAMDWVAWARLLAAEYQRLRDA